MIIGILQCDEIDDSIAQQYGDYSAMVQSLLQKVDNSITFKNFNIVRNEFPTALDQCQAYVTTGSKASVYDSDAWIAQFRQFVITLHEQRIKLVAICFGHQMVADALGGKTKQATQGWGAGVHTNQVTQTPPWMIPKKKEFRIIVSHQDQVTALPPQAELIAGNDFCPNSMFQVGDHILTIQGHPEYTKAYAREKLQGRRAILGEQTYQQAIESLTQPTDELVVARWLLNFINNEN